MLRISLVIGSIALIGCSAARSVGIDSTHGGGCGEAARLVVSPAESTLRPGDTLQMTARDCSPTATGGIAIVRWSSSDTVVAIVDSAGGLVRARRTGSAAIVATDVEDTAAKAAAILQVTP